MRMHRTTRSKVYLNLACYLGELTNADSSHKQEDEWGCPFDGAERHGDAYESVCVLSVWGMVRNRIYANIQPFSGHLHEAVTPNKICQTNQSQQLLKSCWDGELVPLS